MVSYRKYTAHSLTEIIAFSSVIDNCLALSTAVATCCWCCTSDESNVNYKYRIDKFKESQKISCATSTFAVSLIRYRFYFPLEKVSQWGHDTVRVGGRDKQHAYIHISILPPQYWL